MVSIKKWIDCRWNSRKKTLEAMGIYTSSSITSGGSNTGNTNDVNLLSRLIYGESRGEPYTGQVAVRCSCFK